MLLDASRGWNRFAWRMKKQEVATGGVREENMIAVGCH
jgi:hypothetical protein